MYCLKLLFCCVLDCKKWAKMIEFSVSLKLNKIHVVDSPFNKDTKNITFSREAQISGRDGRNFRENGHNGDIYCYANRGEVNFEREYQPLTSWYKKSL